MSKPPPAHESGADDAPWAEQLLMHVRASAEPRAADAARNFASIEARLGIAPIISGSAPRSAGALGLPPALKVGLVICFGLATGVAGYLIGRAELEGNRAPIALDAALATRAPGKPLLVVTPPRADSSETRSLGDVRSAPSSEQRRNTSPTLGSKAPLPRATRKFASNVDDFGLSEALELLRRAEAAVRRADGLEARKWLGDLDRRAPRELLLEERLVTRTLADCVLGDFERARETLRTLEASNPESIYRARLEGSCVADLMPSR